MNNRQNQREQSRMDNPETQAALGTCKTQDENKQKQKLQKTVEHHEPHQRSGVNPCVAKNIVQG